MVAATLSTGESVAELVLGGLGFLTAVWVILAPSPTFWEIRRTQQVGATKLYSYLTVLFNSVMWVVFGIRAIDNLVHGHHHTLANWLDVPLMFANCAGVVVELCYAAVFIRFAVGLHRHCAVAILVISGVVSGIVLAVLFGAKCSRTFVGYIAMLSGVAMYVIPVYTTYEALKNNDLSQISAFQASASFSNGVVWTAYACIGHVRGIVFVPNLTAIICAGGQLIVWAKLKRRAARQAAAEQEEAQRRAAVGDLESGAGHGGDGEGCRTPAQDPESGAGCGGNVQMALQVAAVALGGGAVQGMGRAGPHDQVLHADETEVPVLGGGGGGNDLDSQVLGQKGDGDNNNAGNRDDDSHNENSSSKDDNGDNNSGGSDKDDDGDSSNSDNSKDDDDNNNAGSGAAAAVVEKAGEDSAEGEKEIPV